MSRRQPVPPDDAEKSRIRHGTMTLPLEHPDRSAREIESLSAVAIRVREVLDEKE